jgi:hypothetical protein
MPPKFYADFPYTLSDDRGNKTQEFARISVEATTRISALLEIDAQMKALFYKKVGFEPGTLPDLYPSPTAVYPSPTFQNKDIDRVAAARSALRGDVGSVGPLPIIERAMTLAAHGDQFDAPTLSLALYAELIEREQLSK